MADLQAIADSLIKGQAPAVKELVKEAIDEGVSPAEILSKGLIAPVGSIIAGSK